MANIDCKYWTAKGCKALRQTYCINGDCPMYNTEKEVKNENRTD